MGFDFSALSNSHLSFWLPPCSMLPCMTDKTQFCLQPMGPTQPIANLLGNQPYPTQADLV